jgi:hypothetical protein
MLTAQESPTVNSFPFMGRTIPKGGPIPGEKLTASTPLPVGLPAFTFH